MSIPISNSALPVDGLLPGLPLALARALASTTAQNSELTSATQSLASSKEPCQINDSRTESSE